MIKIEIDTEGHTYTCPTCEAELKYGIEICQVCDQQIDWWSLEDELIDRQNRKNNLI